jgi:hypothetical protein
MTKLVLPAAHVAVAAGIVALAAAAAVAAIT